MIGLVILDNIVEAMENFKRSFLITLDKIVYWFVEQVLQLIVDLANVNIFSDTTINAFARRIYVILGLVMVFKLMISFIQILIDPDAMSDKEKGVGNVLKRVVISMALIVLVPSIFKMARDVQGYILPIIPKVVLGINSDNEVTEPITEHNIGNVMAWYSFLPFFDYANDTCAATGTIQKAVGSDTGEYEIYSVSTAADHINDKDSCNGGDYMYSHKYLISTLVGAYLLFTLVQVALNVAIRAIKFGICEFVAPIPIASYIDPKTSKSTFDKWLNTSIKVYLDLFIQLISIYFVVFVFMVVFKKENIGAILENVGNNMWRATLVMLFIIVGLIKFVKEFPKFLSELLGLKTDGAISSIFKGEGWKTLGKTIGSAAALPAAVAGSAIGNYKYAKQNGRHVPEALMRALGGGVAATARGVKGISSEKGFKETFSSNVRKTTGNSHRRVNKRAIVDLSKKEREDYFKSIDDGVDNSYSNIEKLTADKVENENKRQETLKMKTDISKEIIELQRQQAEARRMGNKDEAEYLRVKIDNRLRANANLQKQIQDYNKKISDAETKINDERANIEKLEISRENAPEVISPFKNSMDGLISNFTGLTAISGQDYINVASKLSSFRSSLYTGEAMKKLSTEDGGKRVDDIMASAGEKFKVNNLDVTYTEMASGLKALQAGASEVMIGGKKFEQSDLQTVQAMYSAVEKDAAIKYVTYASEGKIKNVAIEEGIKQLTGAISGFNIPEHDKQELMKYLLKEISNKPNPDYDPGKGLKEFSDIAKAMETKGNRLSSYERAKKEKN